MNSDDVRHFVNAIESIEDAIDVLIAIERKFDMVGCTYTRNDVNEIFRSHHDPGNDLLERDLTDEEWEEFRSKWFWRKGYSDVMNAGVREAIEDDLFELPALKWSVL